MITNNLKVDQFTKMGIVTDVKQELRKANSLRVSYATRKKVKQFIYYTLKKGANCSLF